MKLRQKLLSLGLALIMSAGTYINSYPASKQNLQIEFINVGAGDAIYIETPSGDDILIDAGTADNGKKEIGRASCRERV